VVKEEKGRKRDKKGTNREKKGGKFGKFGRMIGVKFFKMNGTIYIPASKTFVISSNSSMQIIDEFSLSG